jgi:hypothetical protein
MPWDVMNLETATHAKKRPRVLPLPFGRGEGRGEGSVLSPGFVVPLHADIGLEVCGIRVI